MIKGKALGRVQSSPGEKIQSGQMLWRDGLFQMEEGGGGGLRGGAVVVVVGVTQEALHLSAGDRNMSLSDVLSISLILQAVL